MIVPGLRSFTIHRFRAPGKWSEATDTAAVEEPLEIRVNFGPLAQRQEKTLAITMRTPGNDEELVRGFILSERLVAHSSQIIRIEAVKVRQEVASGHTILADLDPSVVLEWSLLERHFYLSSSCGVCGKASIEAVMEKVESHFFPMQPQIRTSVILSLPEKLRKAQALFASTGGIHASALFDMKGDLLLLREDVGRHNAADKVIGALQVMQEQPTEGMVMVLSGRASFELVQKAFIAGIPILVAVGAPSSLAIDLALEAGMTLIGFAGADRFNVYTGSQRVLE